MRTLARQRHEISGIRPPLIYGADAKGNFALLTRAVSLELRLPFAAIRNHRAFPAVQNLSGWEPQVSLDGGLQLALSAQDA